MLLGAILAALAGAACFGLAAVLQQREAFNAADSRSVDPGLLWRLAHRPLWLAGIAADVAAAGLHVLALTLGPVDVVQPLGVTGLVFAVPIAAMIDRRRMRALDVVAAVAVLGGLTVVLRLLPSSGNIGSIATGTVIAVSAISVALVLAALAAALPAVVPARLRGIILAAAAGCAFGVTAVLVSAAITLLGRPNSGAAIVGAIVGGTVLVVLGYLSLQNAYRVGRFASSLGIAVVLDPLAAIVAATFLLHQPLPTAVGEVALLTLSAAVVIAGLAALVSSPAQLFPVRAEAAGKPTIGRTRRPRS